MASLAIVDKNQSHWRQRAGALAGALLHAAALNGDGIIQVVRAIERQGPDLANYEFLLRGAAQLAAESEGLPLDDRPKDPQANVFYEEFGYDTLISVIGENSAAREERSSIFSSAMPIFQAFKMVSLNGGKLLGSGGSGPVQWTDSFDLGDFLTKPSTIYITVPPAFQMALQPIVAAFLDAIVESWRELEGQQRAPGLGLFLDEAANICPLPQLPRLMTSGGGDKIHLAVGLQDPDQAFEHWGEGGRQIIAAANHHVLFPGIGNTKFLQGYVDQHPVVTTHELRVSVVDSERFASGVVSVDSFGPDFRPAAEINVAPPSLLHQERTLIESSTSGLTGVYRNRILHATLREIWEHRKVNGIGVRSKFLQNASNEKAMYAEIMATTEVNSVHERRRVIELAHLSNPPEGHVYRKSGAAGEMVHLPPSFASTFWREAIGVSETRESKTVQHFG